ncbi:hypothetical protein MYCSP_11900 [Mycobacteroides saopaulense]|uniref:hypothetical protein n=1 Tax=Mycobacteroides saopaulense TaxID=1578165 RepID=UPI0007204593|nr:hypothetical protein [Mycobacteroides saopaulense]ALR12020.1 hypothetical protein MYCSP_11900 [Mycobacteroides saopaulense]
MDRTANPLFKAGMAAITATALVIAPAVSPPTRQAISLPDIRSTAVRLSSFAFTPSTAQAPPSPLPALTLPLLSAAPGVAAAPATVPRMTPTALPAPSVQQRSAAAQPLAPAASSSGAAAAAATGPTVANAITNGIDQAYQFIQYWVDYGVDLAQWGAGFIPVIGGLVSAQIGIVYDNLVRPIANSFVYNLVDPIINDPSFSNIVNSFGRFGSDIVNSVINFAWAEARYFLPPLPPLPGLALQATTDAAGAVPTSVHDALAPFTKAFQDAQAHFTAALGLTKTDQKLATAEKSGAAVETNPDVAKETAKEDGRAAQTDAAVSTKEAATAQGAKESAEDKTPAGDKTTPGVDKVKNTSDKSAADGKDKIGEGTKESPKDPAKDATPPAAVADTPSPSGKAAGGTKPAQDASGAVSVDKPDKIVKSKVSTTASTTEHGAVSAQGTVRGPISQTTTGGKSDAASESRKTDTKKTDTKPSNTKPSESASSDPKTSGVKSPSSTSTHDSASKSSGSTGSSSTSGGGASKSGGGGHD